MPSDSSRPKNKELIFRYYALMSIRMTTFKSLLLFLAILCLVLSFPMQVYAGNPYPALLPYFLIALAILVGLFVPRYEEPARFGERPASGVMSIMIMIYVFLVLLHTSWQTVLNVISIEEGISVLAVYLLPVICYGYFRRSATEQEIRWVLAAMVVAGAIVSVYYIYDSYVKLALGHLNDYAIEAFQYTVERSNQSIEDVNKARISLGYRSYGLLQAPSVSAGWVMLATFAALVFVPPHRRILRQTIVILCGATLLMALNFTSIIAFAIIMFMFEFGGFSVLPAQRSAAIGKLVSFAFFVVMLFGAVLLVAGDAMLRFVLENMSYARDLAFGTGNLGMSMGSLVEEYAGTYAEQIFEHPFIFLLGDGFSTFGMQKGGDVGFIESLAKFGLPFFLAILLGFLVLILRGLAYIRYVRNMPDQGSAELDRAACVQFSVSVFFLILITEGHYTIWVAKSVLPIFFLALALYDRCFAAFATNHPVHRSAGGGSGVQTIMVPCL